MIEVANHIRLELCRVRQSELFRDREHVEHNLEFSLLEGFLQRERIYATGGSFTIVTRELLGLMFRI